MAMEIYQGDGAAATASRNVTLSPRGSIYVGRLLHGEVAASVTHVRIGFDRDLRLLALIPCEPREPGACKFQRTHKSTSGCRVNAKMAMEYFKLRPSELVRVEGVIKDGQVQAIIPTGTAGPTVAAQVKSEAVTPRTSASSAVKESNRRERQKPRRQAKRLERTSPQSETVRGRHPKPDDQEEVGVDEALTSLPQKASCLRCAHFGANIEVCGSTIGPFAGKHVSPRGSCDRFVNWQTRRVKEGGDSLKPPAAGISLHGRVLGPRSRAKCGECGHEFAVTRKGIIPHDTSGVAYIAGRGDYDHRCPGSNTAGKPV